MSQRKRTIFLQDHPPAPKKQKNKKQRTSVSKEDLDKAYNEMFRLQSMLNNHISSLNAAIQQKDEENTKLLNLKEISDKKAEYLYSELQKL